MSHPPFSGRRAPTGRTSSAGGGRSLLGLSAALLAALLAAGCATKGDIRDLREEMQAISVRQDSLLRTLADLQRASLDSLAAQSDVLFSTRGELSSQVTQMQEQLVTIRELTGQSQRALAGLRDQIAARGSAPVQGQARGPAAGADSAGAAPSDTAQAPPSGVESGGSAEDLFNVAVRQFNRGSATTARRAFRRFLEQYPNHRLAPDAHFYLADIKVQEDSLSAAVDAFLQIPELYPTADKVPDALYRAGVLQIQLDEKDDARQLLERVVNSYPDSGAALLAQERLDELSKSEQNQE